MKIVVIGGTGLIGSEQSTDRAQGVPEFRRNPVDRFRNAYVRRFRSSQYPCFDGRVQRLTSETFST
jgi:hypothetical protein